MKLIKEKPRERTERAKRPNIIFLDLSLGWGNRVHGRVGVVPSHDTRVVGFRPARLNPLFYAIPGEERGSSPQRANCY